MPAKPRKSREPEDLASAVLDIINNPITKPKLSLLVQSGPNRGMLSTESDVSNGADIGLTTGVVTSPVAKTPPNSSPDLSAPTFGDATLSPPYKPARIVPDERDRTTRTLTDTSERTPATTTGVDPTPVVTLLPKVHKCHTVQDGHSPAENAVYMLLWSAGKAMNDETKLIQCSISELSQRSGMTEKNVRLMLRRLQDKKTIALAKQPNFTTKAAATYHVYSYKKILRLRREAGLEYVIRNKGVQFIATAEAEHILNLKRMQLDARFPGSTPEITTGVDLPDIAETAGVGNSSSTPVNNAVITPVDSGSYLENKLQQNNSSTTSAHSSLIQQLKEHLGFVEDAVVTTLVANCREKQPDATIEEISHFAVQKALQISRMQSARAPIAVLLASVPRCFEGASFKRFRDERSRKSMPNRELAEERALYWERRAAYWETLNDPNASEDEKRVARGALATMRETQSPDGL